MRRILVGAVAALAVLGGLAAPAHALPKVLICYADPNGGTANTIAAGINPNKQYFDAVDTLDCNKNTPTVNQLKMYEAVFLWDDLQYASIAALGDNLADYVDAGGGVVQGMFNFFNSGGQHWDLQGRWAAGGYSCINAGNQGSDGLKQAPNDVNSPLVMGVAALKAQNVGTAGLAKGAVSVWDYNGGNPAIATCTPNGHLRVDTNFYPNPTNWTGDGYPIIRNALIAVAGGLSPLKGAPNPAQLPDTGTGATSDRLTITFTNTSMMAQTATGLSMTGANAAEFGLVKQPQFPVTLQPMQSFTVDVNFSPASMGMRTAKLSAAIQGNNIAPSDVVLNGNGIGAKLAINPNPINVGGTQVGKTVSTNVSFSNVGGGKIAIANMALSNPAFVISAGPAFPLAIGGGGSFNITIDFTPQQNGISKDTLVITTNDPNSPTITIPVSGFAGPAAISTDAGSIAFGNVNVGARSMPQTLNILNTGFSDLKVTDIQLAGANKSDYALDKKSLPGVIAAQTSAPIGITFAPTQAGNRVAQIVITSDDAMTPTKTVNVFGTGTQAALSVMPMMLDLGTTRIGMSSMPGTINVTTMGSGALLVQSLVLTGPNPDAFSVVQAMGTKVPPFSVAANGTEKINVVCKPGVVGGLAATATINTDIGPATVSLKCAGTSPKVSVTPNVIDFGPVPVNGMSEKVPVTLTNLGTDDLNLMDVYIAGANQGDFSAPDSPNNLPVAIAPNKSVTFNVIYAPTGAGVETGELRFVTDDPLLPTGVIQLTGKGAQAGLSLTPGSIDFGMVIAGVTTAPQPITMKNTGDTVLTINSVVISGLDAGSFRTDRAVDMQNPIVLAPGQSSTLNITYSPVRAGNSMAILTVRAIGLAQSVTASLKGTAFGYCVKIQLPGTATTIDFGDVPSMSASVAQQARLVNCGMTAITIASLAADNPAFKVAALANPTLAAGMTETFSVTFEPTQTGMLKSNINVKLAGSPNPVATVAVTGNATQSQSMSTEGGGCSVDGRRGAAGRGWALLALAGIAIVLMRQRRARR